MQHDLIVFAEDWGGLPSSTQHLISQLAAQRKIVWINSIGLRQPSLNWRDVKRAANKFFTSNSPSKSSNDLPGNNFHIINPRTFPAPRSRFARWLAMQLLILQIKPVVQRAGLHKPILWTSLPTAVDVAGKLGESALIYYCGDDFSALAGVDHDTVNKREAELADKADLILCASEKLIHKFSNSPTFLLPHGVDFSLFSTPTQRATDLPDDGRPIAGFYGSISEWLDIKLLVQTIQQMPDWHFVFIGKAVVDISQLSCLKNVLLLGERAHECLPSYCQHWTASILPFVNNAQIEACNPLKLNEYLAAGRPIISTSFPAMEPFMGLVQTVNCSHSMIEALTASEQLNTLPAFESALRNTVADNSWEARAWQVSQLMETL